MKPPVDFYELSQAAQGAFFGAALAERKRRGEEVPPRPPLLQLRSGYAESPNWMMIQALEFDPEPLTVENIRVRAIWSSERIIAALLELLAGERWLDRIGEAYHLTAEGREILQGITGRTISVLSKIEPLPLAELTRLENYLRRAMDTSLHRAAKTWCLAHSRQRAPAEEAHILVKISAHCSDFNAFRDDCHMAAWQPHAVQGYEWESLTLIWRNEAATAQELYNQLCYRGYSRTEFAQALDQLTERGWLLSAHGRYQLTEAGKAVRETAERATDDYFYAPWEVFSEQELSDFAALLTQLRDQAEMLSE